MAILKTCTVKQPRAPRGKRKTCWNVGCQNLRQGRARKWCPEHFFGSTYYTEHHWGTARLIAIYAACELEHRRHYLDVCRPTCAICGEPTAKPEVDHLDPMKGDDRSGEDCRHHQANLRVLCHDDHALVTANQARARAARKGPPPRKAARLINQERRAEARAARR